MHSPEKTSPEESLRQLKEGSIGANPARNEYEQRIAKYEDVRAALRWRSVILGHIRLLLFVCGVVFLVCADQCDVRGIVLVTALLANGTLFIAVVCVHSFVNRSSEDLQTKVAFCKQRISAIDREWSEVPRSKFWSLVEREQVPLQYDLQLSGFGSLCHLMSIGQSLKGVKKVVGWLTCPAGRSDILRRQEAVKELAAASTLMQNLAVARERSQQTAPKGKHPSRSFVKHRGLFEPSYMWALSVPIANLTLVALFAYLKFSSVYFVLVGLLVLLVNFTIARLDPDLIADLQNRCDQSNELLTVCSLLQAQEWRSSFLREIDATLQQARQGFRSLEITVALANMRRSILYPFLQFFFGFDLIVSTRARRWVMRWHADHDQWVDALAELEALQSFAVLCFENPHWTFPDIAEADKGPLLDADELGHPLLHQGKAVRNSLCLGAELPLAIFTGSNMSGKSTFLRAIGVNAVLALAGGPVCAGRFQITPLKVLTSIVISDSLTAGRSLYMAELLRLKSIVDEAKDLDKGRVLFLFDEILHGTNPAERSIAVKAVVSQLVAAGAIGVVTTHDLAITDSGPRWRPSNYHFSESICPGPGAIEIVFDYVLRQGPSRSSNALRLLKAVGLEPASGFD